jgi:hypothetical protein
MPQGADPQELDAVLRAAHARGDTRALVTLYARAADRDPRAEAFYLTQAYVHALETGAAEAAPLRARLVALGAEPPGPDPAQPPEG